MNNIAISVIVPVYNVEQYLAECLESILCQDFHNYEVICVNDASTDKSMDLLQEYAERYHNIKIVRHTVNRGLSAARNTGIKNARGKYLMFVDSDDMVMSDALAELYCVAEQNCVDIIYYNMMRIDDEDCKNAFCTYISQYECNAVYSGRELFCMFVDNNQRKIEVCRQFIRREFLKEQKIEFYEGILHEDELFSFLCAMNAQRVADVNKEYYIYRQRNGSIMSNKDYRRAESLFVVLVKIMTFWTSHIFTDRENYAIAQHFRNLYYTYRYYLCFDNSKAELEVGGIAEKTLFALMQDKDESQYLTLNEHQMEELKNAVKVIVFGAGKAAIDIVKILQRKHIRIDAIAVNDVSVNPKMLCGIQVDSIDNIAHYMMDATVIIGVTEKYRRGILDKLKHLGYDNVIVAEDKKSSRDKRNF